MHNMQSRFYHPTQVQTFFTIGALTGLSIVVFSVTLVHAVWYAPEGMLSSEQLDPSSSMVMVPDNAAGNQYRFSTSTDTASSTDNASSTTSTTAGVTLSSTFPERFIIPSLGIDANVQRVGIARSGAMGVPSNFTDVAWYRYGTIPGDAGSAVIDGHVDNGLALAGVFKHLSDLKVGDDIEVKTFGGKILHFAVTDMSYYGYKDVPVEAVFNQNDAAYLKLITCSGSWVSSDKTYNHRLVVTAKLLN